MTLPEKKFSIGFHYLSPQQGALIRDILEGNFTSDDIEAAISIIRTSRRQPGTGFGLEEQIGDA